MLQIVFNTICGKFSLNAVAGTSAASTFRIPSLDHKAADYAVEDQTVIKVFIDQTDKIVYGNSPLFGSLPPLHR